MVTTSYITVNQYTEPYFCANEWRSSSIFQNCSLSLKSLKSGANGPVKPVFLVDASMRVPSTGTPASRLCLPVSRPLKENASFVKFIS